MTTTRSHILCAIFRQLKSRPSFDSIGIKKYRELLEKSALAFKPDKSIETESFHIKNIEAKGGTNINEALLDALKMKHQKARPLSIVFLMKCMYQFHDRHSGEENLPL